MGKIFKEEDSEEEILEIIEKFEPKIKKSIYNTSLQDRDDLEQEIKIKIYEKLSTIQFREPPSL